MSTWVVVGDMHVVVDELEDAERCVDYATKVALDQGAEGIIYLGDLHHNHALVNVHIVAFWRRKFREQRAHGFRVIALTGNHDMPGDGTPGAHALLAYEDIIEVVSQPSACGMEGVMFMPYMSKDDFLAWMKGKYCNLSSIHTIFCHQDFDGAQYENGFYSPNGVSPSEVPFQVISGHIHSPQRFSNVWYVGAPRWRTLSDANIERAIWTVEIEKEGVVPLKAWPTSKACKVIRSITLTPEYPDVPIIDLKDEYRIHIEGPRDFVEEQAAKDFGAGVGTIQISTLITDDKAIQVKESEGIAIAFKKYVEAYTPQFGTSKDRLAKLAIERIRL